MCGPTEPAQAPWPGLQIHVLPSVEAVAQAAASALLQARWECPPRPLGLATGRTMEPVYASLATLLRERPSREQIALRQEWLSFNLDEYVGLGPMDAEIGRAHV